MSASFEFAAPIGTPPYLPPRPRSSSLDLLLGFQLLQQQTPGPLDRQDDRRQWPLPAILFGDEACQLAGDS